MSWINNERYRTAFIRLLSPSPNEKILDVGAGKGQVASFVQLEGSSEVHVLDPNKKRIVFLQRKHPNLKTCLSGSDSIPYVDGFFDKVYSTMAVHHFPDQQKSFRELARVLKPDGLFVIVDISPRTLLGKVSNFWENTILRSHLTFLDLEQLVGLLTHEGRFEVGEAHEEGPGYFVRAVRTKVV